MPRSTCRDGLRDHALSLPGVRRGVRRVSVPGAVAFYLDEPLNPPTMLAERLIQAGWAEYHSLVSRGHLPPLVVMPYGPRDEDELALCASAVEEAYLANGRARHDATGHTLGFSLT